MQLHSRSGQQILGVDFSSAPGKHKAITVAVARLHSPASSQRAAALAVERVSLLRSLDEFAALLAQPGPWLMGVDAPLSQPLPLLAVLGWSTLTPEPEAVQDLTSQASHSSSAILAPCDAWREAARRAGALDPSAFKAELQRFCDGQPPGHKHLKRRCDALAGAVSPISSVRTPVAQMYHRLAPMLLRSGVCIAPFMCASQCDAPDTLQGHGTASSGVLIEEVAPHVEAEKEAASSSRVVVEVYPGLVARRLAAADEDPLQAPQSGASLGAAASSTSTHSRKRRRQASSKVVVDMPSPAASQMQAAPAALPRHAPAYKGSNKDAAGGANARQKLLQAAKQHCGSLYGFELVLEEGIEEQCVADSKGDVLDAVLAAMQAGWAAAQGPGACFGAPLEVCAEGWIHDPWMLAIHAHAKTE